MARLEPQEHPLKDHQKIITRTCEATDAAQYPAFSARIASETNFTLQTPERKLTSEQVRPFIAKSGNLTGELPPQSQPKRSKRS